MPRRLLLEGADPEALLVRARDEHGPEVRVVHAERVRTGGVLGLFARESYSLTLEVPDASEAPLRPASSLVPGVRVDDAAAELADELADVAAVSRELLAAVGRGGVAEAAPAEASEASDDFAALLARLVATPQPPEAPAAPLHVPVPARRGNVASEAREFTPARFPSAATTDRVVARLDAPVADPADPTAEELVALGVPAEALATDGPCTLAPLARRLAGTASALEPGELLVVLGEPERALAVASQVAQWHGMPATAVALAGDAPATPGHGRRIRSAAGARALRERIAQEARRTDPAIVALGIDEEAGGAPAEALLDAFGAQACWLACAPEDVPGEAVEHLRAAGRIDAVAIVGATGLPDPGRLLGGPLPVAWLDGLPATAVVWAARLDQALGAHRAREARPRG
ncbi:hypothetical protein [Demequina iriomotensis]|uniref:hypothetical protein n=1 Tax=Demequina iriomotensis TaxID=1536641 RepID=UPI000781602A|nr:hypothetical protein [Demequina iriomotensis]